MIAGRNAGTMVWEVSYVLFLLLLESKLYRDDSDRFILSLDFSEGGEVHATSKNGCIYYTYARTPLTKSMRYKHK